MSGAGDGGTTAGDYERIRRACLKRGELWEDPEFPAAQASVFYHQTPPFQFQWRRPRELCARPVFVADRFDVTSGKMGDRWLVSCLAVLHHSKGLFYRVVPADQSFQSEQYAGVFRFRVWWCGEWTEVLVDDRLPTVHGRLAFLHARRTDQFWPGLLEKAYAKLHGSYEALKYGTLLDGLADLTGGITETLAVPSFQPQAALDLVQRLLDTTTLVTCTIQQQQQQQQSGGQQQQPTPPPAGLQVAVSYRVCALERVEPTGTYLVRLRQPAAAVPGEEDAVESRDAEGEYTGAWCRPGRAPQWDAVPVHELERLRVARHAAEGDFWMACSDWARTFTHLELVHLDSDTSRDEPSLQGRATWHMRLHQGAWVRGVSAGGCRNNPETFHMNPQLQLTLSEPGQEVVVSLNQHSVMEPKVIGFSVYSTPAITNTGSPSPSASGDDETLGRQFFRKNKSMSNSQYTNSRQVSHRCYGASGQRLIVVPTTFEPGQESGFTVRVFSARPLKLRALDVRPGLTRPALVRAPAALDTTKGFGQYEAVFLQLADEHRTVNAFELQELLDACLPNDYIKSCASLEVCRQAVLAMDSTGPGSGAGASACSERGRLKFAHFKDLMCSLKYWQTAFKSHTKEKTGILKVERLRDALADVGFRLSADILTVLVHRYMRKDGTLRFGDFVSAVLHLSVTFRLFEARDPLRTGATKLTLAEWLKSSLMC